MLLDRIDIDSHGPLARVTLGPFSQTLNAIVAASGSGKTALVRFIRDSLTGTTPARDGLAQSIGRVVWSAADGFYHCRRTPNGTAQGHRFVEFENRTADPFQNSRIARESIVVDLPACVVDGIVTDTVLTSALHCIQAAIAAGLDHTAVSGESSRDIEVNELRREIAELERQIHSHTLHSQLASARYPNAYESFGLTLDMKRLRDRRAELSLEISAIDARRDWAAKSDAEMDRRRRKRELFASITDEVERLRRQESELRSRLSEVEAGLERMDDDASRAVSRAAIAKAYRVRLEQVDTQLIRVRSVVREIRALGDHWFGGRRLTAHAGWLEQTIDGIGRVADDSSLLHDAPLDDSTIEHSELNVTDRGWSSALANNLPIDSSITASTVDVQRRIDTICRLVDNLVGRCEEHQSETVRPQMGNSTGSRLADWDSWAEAELDRHERRRVDLEQTTVVDPADKGERFEPTHNLDRAERLLQEERTYRADSLAHAGENVGWLAGVLNGVSQRLRGLAGRRAAYGSSNVDPLFHVRRDEHSFADLANDGAVLDPQAQVAAVRRCERELIDALRRLVARRDVMLRRIAEVQNQPLSQVIAAISDTLVSHDDPQLYQWLVRDRITASESDAKQRDAARTRLNKQRADLVADLQRTLNRTTDRIAEAETIRLYLRSLPVVHRHNDDANLRARLVAEIRAIDEQLARPRINPAVLERHAQCVTRLRALTAQGPELSGLSALASEYLQRLSGGRLSSITWQRSINHSSAPANVAIDSRMENSCSPTERFIAAVAVRLAAADELARRGRGLPVLIETPSLRQLSSEASSHDLRSMLQTGIDALAECTRRGRQIVLLTDDAVLADTVMRVGGSVQSIRGAMQPTATLRTEFVNSARPQSTVPTERMYDVNRDFDLAWREANDDDATWRQDDRNATDRTADYQNSRTNFTEFSQTARDRYDVPAAMHSEPSQSHTEPVISNVGRQTTGRAEATAGPFFLTGHSPIDQGPSINSHQAARLRAVGIQRIEHLLAANPKELAGSVRLDDVDTATLRRWQHECRLVCGVRKLRGFDARVLVGCGITHPRELAETDPRTLVERIEAFMATDRGGRILRAGSDQEIARLTDWINQTKSRAGNRSNGHVDRQQPRVKVTTTTTSTKAPRQQHVREPRVAQSSRAEREPRRSERTNATVQKFHLQRDSDVEAGPSIGPRMAERLHRIGVQTVNDLVTRSASSIADALRLSKVDAGLVRQWQQQATLVCRVPMLRGHDSQLLVAAGITEPERLAECDATWLLNQIEPIANSREGKAILRGGKHPDLAEMREWIGNAQQHRELVAA